MARDFHAAANMSVAFDPAYAAAIAARYIADDDKICLVMDCDGVPVGVLSAHIYQFQLAPVMAANELMWWIDPAYRGRDALAMLSAYEDWARFKGAAIVGMATSPIDERVSMIYRRRGYMPAGIHFCKTI